MSEGLSRYLSLGLLSLSLLLAGSATGLAQEIAPNGEERFVRQTYLRLSLLNRADLARNRERDAQVDEQPPITFVLTEFRTGPIEEILSRPIGDVATFPTGEIIRLVERSHIDKPNPEETVSYEAQWRVADYSNTLDPRTATVSEMLKLMGSSYLDVGKYTSYAVTVTLRGKSRSYRALVLYHSPYGSSTDQKPEFWDAIVGSGGVMTDISKDSRPPAGSRPRRQKDESQPPSPSDKPTGGDETAVTAALGSYCDGIWPICCPASGGLDECCWDSQYPWGNPGFLPTCRGRVDGGGGGGGGGGGTGPEGPSLPPEPACEYKFRSGQQVNLSHSDSAGHYDGYKITCTWPGGFPYCYSVYFPAGEHRAETLLRGECITHSDCAKRCNVVVDSHSVYDYGNTFLYHVVKERNADSNDATGTASSTLLCSGGYGYAVDQCLTPFCPITLTVTISGTPLGVGVGGSAAVQTSAMWSAGHALSHQCEPGQ